MAEDVATPAAAPLQVLLVADDDAYDRLGGIMQHLCVGLIDDPVQMRVLLRTNRSDTPEAIGPAPVRRVRHRRWPFDRRRPERALEALGGRPPDIIHALSARTARWARSMSLAWNGRLIAHVTDLEDVRELCRWPDEPDPLAVTVTPQLHVLLTQARPAGAARVRLIPLGVPAEEEPACLADPQRIPAAIVTTPLTADCGLAGVLRALQTLVRGGQEVHLFILSAGRAEAGFRRQVEHLELYRHVTFAGAGADRETVNAAMRGADFFLEPNPARRFTAQMLTAMADGLAILAPHGTLQDYLIDGTTARLFDPVRSGDLAEKWGQLLLDRSAARLLAQSALDYVRARHQATRMVTATASLYRELGADGSSGQKLQGSGR